MATEKAFLEIEGGVRIPCLFNPAQLRVSRANDWDSAKGAGKGITSLTFQGSSNGTMALDLFFDTTSDGTPVTRHTGRLLELMDISVEVVKTSDGELQGRPPYVTFHWGDLHSFKAVITQLELTFTYFSASGVPLRAMVNLSLLQFEASDAFGPQNPTSGTPRPARVHRVQPGETLDRIAARYYGDSTQWRALATVNGLGDPLALRPGTLLSVPRRHS